jgi:FkbM family methyltransferase
MHSSPRFLRRRIKTIVNRFLTRRGQVIARHAVVPSPQRFFDMLCARGLRPQTVFDVGVAEGTPWLYTAFPAARYFLFDPLRESVPHMERWASKLNAGIFNVALGSQNTTARIHVREKIIFSTLYAEEGKGRNIDEYDVQVRRFDAVIGSFMRPSLCKIDVQGAELDVLLGMGNRLREIDAFVVEVNLIPFSRDCPELYDVMSLMHESGYALFDIIGIHRRPLDQALGQLDAVFVPDSSPLRQDRRWA